MIDRDMRGVTAMLETLALMPSLQQEDFATFHQLASRITERHGIVILLTDRTERQRLNTRVPWNTPLPSFFDDDVARSVLETRMPRVSDLVIGPVSGTEVVGIVVPVFRAGEVAYFLTASLPLKRIEDILTQARIGDGLTATVTDRKGNVLSRVPAREGPDLDGQNLDGPNRENAGGAGPPGRIASEGVTTAAGPGGADLVSGYSRSDLTGWVATVDLPDQAVDAAVMAEIWSSVLLGSVLLALSGLLAYGLGLRMSRAAQRLTLAGRALRGGEAVPRIRTGWREANEIGLALTTAFQKLDERSMALRAAESQYRILELGSPVGIFRTDPEGRCTGVNERWCEMAGARPEQALGNGWTDFLHPEDYDRVFSEWRRSALENRPFRLEYRFRTPSGKTTWVLGESLVERNDTGEITGFVGTTTDITANKLLERQLIDAEEQLARAMAAGRMFAFDWDIGTDEVRRSEGCAAILGLEGNATADTGRNFFATVHPEDRAEFAAAVARLEPASPNYTVSYRYQRPDGAVAWLEESAAAVFDRDGRKVRLTGITADVTARKQVEAALRESEERLRFALDAAAVGIWQMDVTDTRMAWNDIQYRLFGIDPATPAPSLNAFGALIDPKDRATLLDRIDQAVRTGRGFELDFRVRRPPDPLRQGEEVRWLSIRCGVQRNAAGKPERIIGVNWDVTERKTAEAILRDSNAALEARVAERTRALTDAARELTAEIRRREETQAALLQSQKLEALGQLVSGVSHDFNNILAVIQSSYSLLRRRIDVPEQVRILDLGEQAVVRATGLIHHLLAFARREETQPALVDLAAILRESEDMICHTAGSGVRCAFDLQDDLWPVIVDPSRLNAVLLNLAANARDAMPNGGELEISARNLPADERTGSREGILISVKDSGVGMTPEVVARASEPFFTTKPRGRGTGLGLASAHALTTQSGGKLRILSAIGTGTTIELHLPRAQISAHKDEQLPDAGAAPPEGATILLVDDDDSLRALTAHLLRDLGYAVIEARSAETAIALAHLTDPLDLVVTDIMMPGDSGPVLGTRLRLDRPNLPVLFISGDREDTVPDGERLLRKPFSKAQLAEAVLERLGRLPPALQAEPAAADKLRNRLRSPRLRDAYDRWKKARATDGGLPGPDLFPPDDGSVADNGFLVEVIGSGRTGEFRYLRIGDELARRLGRPLVGELVDDGGEELGSAGASYRRCIESESPSYEYARYALADAAPLLFERLLLPLSSDGTLVTHILGIACFTDLTGPDAQQRSRP
ncbi:PAS domain-containing protein [Skermanella mucosa]|uniref:PAS domain-containing protein n=1 Tax=Skermanella mucosa TaxID=1789672 RepID=UPI002B2088F8|nr:PAS domain-containing protein [Skermanella mucosa]